VMINSHIMVVQNHRANLVTAGATPATICCGPLLLLLSPLRELPKKATYRETCQDKASSYAA
jgi:hypothetical protein